MTYIQKDSGSFRKACIALAFGGFVTFANLYTTQPLLPVFSQEFSISPTLASLALSLSTGMLAIMLILAAILSDRFGKKQIMEISMLLTSVLAICLAFSPNFRFLLVLRALLGIVAAGVPSLAMAYVAEEFHPSSIGHIMGLYISGTTLGGLVGRMLTGLLTDLFTWQTALFVIGLLSLFLSIIFIMILPKPQHAIKRPMDFKTVFCPYRVHILNRPLLSILVLGFIFMGSFVTLFNYIGYLLSEPPFSFSQTLIGLIFVVYLFGSFSSVYMGKKADIQGHAKVLQISVLLTIAGALLTSIQNIVFILIGLSLFTFGFFASHSVASSWIGANAKENKAQASSLYLLFYYLGSSIVGTIGGLFWIRFHWAGILTFVMILLLMSFPLIHYAQKRFSVEIKMTTQNRPLHAQTKGQHHN